MKRRILSLMIALGIALTVGCQHFKREEDHAAARKAKIAVMDLPAEVRSGFERDFPGAKIRQAERETYADGTVHYEIKYTAGDGTTAAVEYSDSGEQLDEH